MEFDPLLTSTRKIPWENRIKFFKILVRRKDRRETEQFRQSPAATRSPECEKTTPKPDRSWKFASCRQSKFFTNKSLIRSEPNSEAYFFSSISNRFALSLSPRDQEIANPHKSATLSFA